MGYSNLNFLEFYAKKRCRVLITVETNPSPHSQIALEGEIKFKFPAFFTKKSGKFEFYLTLKFPLLQICRVFCNINIKIQEEMQNKKPMIILCELWNFRLYFSGNRKNTKY